MLAGVLRGINEEGSGIPTDGLILAYSMGNRSDTTIIDDSSSGLDATATASVTFPAGIIGDCALFDSSADYISTPDNAILRPTVFSLSLWVKFTTTSNTVICEKDGNNGWSLQTSASNIGQAGSVPGRIILGAGGTTTVLYGTTVVRDNNWHHVVAIQNGSSDKMYIDGVDVTSSQTTGNATYSTGPLIFGQRVGGAGQFPGSIDQFRLYNRALTPAEVTQLYNEA